MVLQHHPAFTLVCAAVNGIKNSVYYGLSEAAVALTTLIFKALF